MTSSSKSQAPLRTLVLVAIAVCLAPVAIDRWESTRFAEQSGRAVALERDADALTLEVQALERAFAQEVHAWKNMLLRGADPMLVRPAILEFDAGADQVERALLQLRERPMAKPLADLLLAAHRALNAEYRAAFAKGSTADLAGLQAIDAAVRGHDRSVERDLHGFTAQLLQGATRWRGESASLIAAAESEADWVRFGSMIAAALLLGGLFGFAYRMNIRVLRHEIDARRAAEQSLAATAAEFKQIFDTMQGIYIRTQLDGRIDRVNPAAVHELGYASAEEMLRTSMRDIYAYPAQREPLLQRVLAEGRVDASRAAFRRKDGSTLEVEVNIHTILDANGKLLGVEGFAINISKRLEAEARERATNEKFKNMFERMQDGYMKADLNGTILLVNPALARLLRYESESALVGKHIGTDVYANPAEREQVLARLLKDGHTDNIRASWKRADGTTVMIESNVRLERDEHGEPCAVDGLVRDITVRVRQEEELSRAREAAVAASHIKSQFLANMSHEIRTPMNAIVGLSQLALQLAVPPRVRGYLDKISSAAGALLGLLNDILDFSKMEAGMLVLESSAFELDRVLEDLSNAVAVKAEEKRVELLFSVGDDVPPALIGDPLRFTQVLLNLVSNGIKFTESGGEVVVSFTVVARDGDRAMLHCSVRDTGVGLREEQRAKLFQPFTQGDSASTRRHGGSGLGLAISQDLVRRMGGNIEVQSEPGKGSTFSFTIDLGVARGPLRSLPFPDLRGLRALVVDDNQTAREILERSLRSLSFEVVAVSSGAEALSELAQAAGKGAPFELVLLDWKMPEMDGFEVARRIRADARLTKQPLLFMITSFGRQEMLEMSGEFVADAVLVKPLSRSSLIDALMRALAGGQVHTDETPVAPRRAAWAGVGGGAHVLIVEDNEVNRQVVRELLEIGGFKVETVSGGQEALDRLRQSPHAFQVILMDVQMPDMDGYETARAIRGELKLEVPIVALTAHAFEAERNKSIEAGMNDHVTKPIDAEGLVAVLLRWTQK